MMGMKAEEQFPQTLMEAVQFFSKDDNAFNFMVELRWPNGVCCPRCGGTDTGFISTRKTWECHSCTSKKQFSVKVGTIFEDSALPIAKWLAAIWMIANAKNGVSSYEIHRSIGVTQKTAWFMLHRIRLALQTGSFERLSGDVEGDETYIGGKAEFKHRDRPRDVGGRNRLIKVTMAGLFQRSTENKASRIKIQALDIIRGRELFPIILQNVERGSSIFTDAFRSYRGLHHAYTCDVINHAISYVQERVHTNGLENFWSLLKRTLRGTYLSVDPVHLRSYLDEQAFRFNERKDNFAGRFLKAAKGVIGRRLRCLDLIDGKGAEDLPPQSAKAW